MIERQGSKGAFREKLLSSSGPGQFQVHFRPGMTFKKWSRSGPGLVQVWSRSGPGLAQLRSSSRLKLDSLELYSEVIRLV